MESSRSVMICYKEVNNEAVRTMEGKERKYDL